MATLATAQWWVRTDGNDANGGGYDSGIGGAATNYCDQASPQATWTQLTLAAGTLTDAGALGLFTAAMIGNAVNVPGQGYYWVTARTNSNVVTVTPGTGATTSFTTRPGKLGGALRNPYALSNAQDTVAAPATATALVPGNRINLRASGSGSVGSPDYSWSSWVGWPSGDTTNGFVCWIAYNGTPYVVGTGLAFYNFTNHSYYGIYFSASSNVNGSFGVFGQCHYSTWQNCTVDMNNQSGLSGLGTAGAGTNSPYLINTTINGGGSSSGVGMNSNNSYITRMKNCKVTGCGGGGVKGTSSANLVIVNCDIYSNTGAGVYLQNSAAGSISVVDGCTIDSNSGDGVYVADTATATQTAILNSNVTNNGGYGINVAAGSTTANDAAKLFADYNNVWTNTSGNYHNISAGVHDLSVDPQYVGGSPYDYTPANTLLKGATAPQV